MINSRDKSKLLRMYEMAISDGFLDKTELTFIVDFALSRNISEQDVDEILRNPHKLNIPETLEEKVSDLYLFARLSWADGEVSEEEVVVLEKFAKRYGFMDENISALVKALVEAAEHDTGYKNLIS